MQVWARPSITQHHIVALCALQLSLKPGLRLVASGQQVSHIGQLAPNLECYILEGDCGHLDWWILCSMKPKCESVP